MGYRETHPVNSISTIKHSNVFFIDYSPFDAFSSRSAGPDTNMRPLD